MPKLVPGDVFEDVDGAIWLVLQRKRWPEAPMLMGNVHTGELAPLDSTLCKRRLRLSLRRMLLRYAEARGSGVKVKRPKPRPKPRPSY